MPKKKYRKSFYTSLASVASAIISIQPLKVAYSNKKTKKNNFQRFFLTYNLK